MSKIKKFYKDGFIECIVKFNPIINRPIIYIEDKVWYQFSVDEINILEDNKFKIISRNMLSIDGKKVGKVTNN